MKTNTRTIVEAIEENGYVNGINCRKCGDAIGFLDTDIEWDKRQMKSGDELSWDIYGYITCPSCGTQTVVRIKRATIINEWIAAKFDTTWSVKK